MNQRRKILFVIDALDRFGATWQLHLLTRGIAELHDVHIAVLGGRPDLPDWLTDGDDSRTWHFLAAETDFAARQSFRTLARSGLRLRKLVQRIDPDLVHAWCHVAERVTLAATADLDSIRKVATELYLRPSSNMTLEAIDRRLGQSVERFVVSHKEIKSSLVAHDYRESMISIVPPAIAAPPKIDRHAARKRLLDRTGLAESTKTAGAVAPLVPRSRLKDTIWATDLLTCIRDDVHFFIFGSGPQRSRLEKFASQTEAGHHIHFVDSQIAAMELIPGFDFFWQSHLNEPLPSAMQLAMLSEVPVISVFGPGTVEILKHQETAFAVNFGARDEFARWTKYLLEQTESGAQLAVQGRASLEGRFDVAAMVSGYLEIYDVGF